MALNAATPDVALVVTACAYLVDIKDHGSKFDIITAEMLIITLAEDPSLVVLGVCMQHEADKNGYIKAPNNVHIPVGEFVNRTFSVDTPIAVTFGSGHHSTMAMTILLAVDYTNVTSLKGGFGVWIKAVFPVPEYVALYSSNW